MNMRSFMQLRTGMADGNLEASLPASDDTIKWFDEDLSQEVDRTAFCRALRTLASVGTTCYSPAEVLVEMVQRGRYVAPAQDAKVWIRLARPVRSVIRAPSCGMALLESSSSASSSSGSPFFRGAAFPAASSSCRQRPGLRN